jgi:hypothetical protein
MLPVQPRVQTAAQLNEQAAAIAATHGYTIAFGVSAGLLGLGFILVIVLLPSRRRLADLREAGAATPAAPGPSLAPAPPAVAAVSAQQPASEAIPVALCSCSPVITPVAGSHPVSASMGRITRMH